VRMKILANGTVSGDPRSYIADERRRVGELEGEGLIEQFYFKDGGVVMILEAAGVEAAEAKLATLPMVIAGVLSFELTALRATPTGS
jgi:hypothetical protein